MLMNKQCSITRWWSVLTIVLIALVTIPGVVMSNSIKIGVVNTEKILRESSLAVQAQKKIEQEFMSRDDDIKKITAQAKTLQDRLEKDGGNMEETERRSLQRNVANLSREYQRAQKQLREDLSARQNEEYGVILDRINRAISKIAEREKYDLILQLQDSVYRSQRIAITEQVIKAIENE